MSVKLHQNAKTIANKIVNPDGSITTMQGIIPENPDREWINADVIPNRLLEPDGTIGTFNFGSGGGGTGTNGYNGWTPIIALVSDGDRVVQQVVNWTGGVVNKPQAGVYVGTTGFVNDISQAKDIRGLQGVKGNDGLNATINGLNVLDIVDGKNTTVEIIDNLLKINVENVGSGGGLPTVGINYLRDMLTYDQNGLPVWRDATITSPQLVYVDANNDDIDTFEDGSINFPYSTIQKAIDNAPFGATILVSSATYGTTQIPQNVVIHNKDNLTIVDVASVLGQYRTVVTGSLIISGTSQRIGIKGIQFNGSYDFTSTGSLIYIDNIAVRGLVNLSTGGYHRYDDCFFHGVFIQGTTIADFISCQCEDTSTWELNGVGAIFSTTQCRGARYVHKNGFMFSNKDFNVIPVGNDVGILSTSDNGILWVDGLNFLQTDLTYASVQKTGNCPCVWGNNQFNINNSQLIGAITYTFQIDNVFDGTKSLRDVLKELASKEYVDKQASLFLESQSPLTLYWTATGLQTAVPTVYSSVPFQLSGTTPIVKDFSYTTVKDHVFSPTSNKTVTLQLIGLTTNVKYNIIAEWYYITPIPEHKIASGSLLLTAATSNQNVNISLATPFIDGNVVVPTGNSLILRISLSRTTVGTQQVVLYSNPPTKQFTSFSRNGELSISATQVFDVVKFDAVNPTDEYLQQAIINDRLISSINERPKLDDVQKLIEDIVGDAIGDSWSVPV